MNSGNDHGSAMRPQPRISIKVREAGIPHYRPDIRVQVFQPRQSKKSHAKRRSPYTARVDKLTDWQQSLLQRKAYNKVVVAMAHRTARRIWAVLAKGCAYDPSYPQRAAATAL